MPELFDLVAGSESGAIIATSLVLPNEDPESVQKNQYFADTTMKWFTKNTDILYHNSSKYVGLMQSFAFILSLFLSTYAYRHVDKSFEDKDYEEILGRLSFILKQEKKIAKGYPYDKGVTAVKTAQAEEDIISHDGPYYQDIRSCFAEVKQLRRRRGYGDGYVTTYVSQIRSLQETIYKIEQKIATHEGQKYPACFFTFVVLYPILVYWVAP